ncbi:hypothetical protein KAR91_12250, partial [Candidatus Pacearchaeota archaeon]|nr:hypothetical protein [Candidatus Pacearchaeota archaeon]
MINVSQQQFIASVFGVRDGTDSTKLMQFDVSAIGTGATKTITMPNANVDLTRLTAVAGTAEALKALVVDSNIDIDTIRNFTATGAIQGGSITDGTATLSGGNLTGMGNITGTDVDINAGAGHANIGQLTVTNTPEASFTWASS